VRRVALTLSVLTATGLVLTACGGRSSPSLEAPIVTLPKVEGSQTVTQHWPLTGLKVPTNKTAKLHQPVLVAKMDNTVSSQPQVGLGRADMVVEELVEGGLTRLAAFYYSHVPRKVGPIRSMRASDIAVVSPVHASMVTSGAAGKTIARIKAAHIRFYGQAAKGMYRTTHRAAPYNLFVHLRKVAAVAKRKRARTTPNYLAWGSAKDLPQGHKVTKIRAEFSAVHTTEWVFRNGRYHNTDSNAPARDQFPATNVLVLRVREGDAGYLDPAGNHVPVTLLKGSGNALLFHDGRMVAATWHKGKAPTSRIKLTTRNGQKLEVPAGHTWIELVPVHGGNVTFSKKRSHG
jgi:Protein of unknown function (DUF3048) N-terminal domain/Protein of unknown function (DUF3048) C-terminal domain